MLSQKRIQSCINSMTKSHVCACMYACMHTCTEKSGRKEANTLKSYLWMGGLMTTIFLSFSGAGEVDLKSLKYIHITLNFSFFSHCWGNLWMYFHCKNPNTLPLPIEKNQHYKGQKSLFLRIGQSAWYNLTIWPFLCILTDQNRWCLHLWGPHRLINCISILMKAQHSFKDFLFSENSFSLIGDSDSEFYSVNVSLSIS